MRQFSNVQDVCLLDNNFVVADEQKVSEVLNNFGKQHECNLQVRQFARLQVGEGISEQDAKR